MSRHLFAATVLALALSVTSRPSAQTVSPQVLDLADAASVVLTGRVTGVSVRADAGAIYTYATIAVAEVLKGELRDTSVVVKQLGGTLPTIGLYIADQARFAADEDVLLFLAVRPRDGTLYTVGLSRGKWPVLPDLATGTSVATNAGERVAVDAALRSAIRDSAAHADEVTTVPRELEWVTPSFTFIPSGEGGPARWHEADDGRRIPIDYQTIPGGLPGGGNDQLTAPSGRGTASGRAWSWSGVGAVRRSAPLRTSPATGASCCTWNDPCGEVSDSDSATFGLGGGFFTPGFQKTINGVTFNKFLQGLAILNNAGPHLSGSACLQDAVTHVLGHAVGFGHSNSPGAVMYPTLRPGVRVWVIRPGGDDIDGLRFIYPAIASGGSPPQTPTNLTSSVVLDTVTLSWTPATSGGTAQSFLIEASYGPGQPVIASLGPVTQRRSWWCPACRPVRTSCGSRHATPLARAASPPGPPSRSARARRRVRRRTSHIPPPTTW